ncbi:MAG: SPOR domain-containing protein [Treponema sp.]|nr:SPOR domain-containing protein [Treponema sp.]
MEQKRTLWIIAAAGMFLLVVLGAAFILYSPAQKTVPAVATNQTYQTPAQQIPQGNGWTNMPPAYNPNGLLPPGSGEIHTKDLTVYTENAVVYGKETAEGTTIDLNALKAAAEMAPAQETVPQNINITVNLPETKVETAPSLTVTEVPVQIVQADRAFEPEPVKEVKKAAAPAPAPAKTSAPAKTAETKVAEQKQAVMAQYWVQAAAYSNKKTAENARSVLDDNKIPADIFTYQDAKGKVFYRVRVGPYTTKSEAEYWRTKIDKIAAFSKAESYITTN